MTSEVQTLNFEDSAFRLPERFRDTTYEDLYSQIIDRLRSEAAGLPMGTIQLLLLERIATAYITMKDAENADNPISPIEQKNLNTFWLSMVTQFNSILVASGDKYRDALLKEIGDIIEEGLELISEKSERIAFRKHIGESFDRLGV